MFDFTEDDLKSNKRGFLTKTQRDMLRMTARGVRRTSRSGVYVMF